MTYCVTSTTGLMDRTPARRRRSRIHTGVDARLLTPWTPQPTNVGQAAGASRCTTTESRDDDVEAAAPARAGSPIETSVRGTLGVPRDAAVPATRVPPLAPSSSDHASMVSGSVASNTSTSLV